MTPPARGYAYFLDVDGTLIDLTDAPGRLAVVPAVAGVVEALYRSSDGAIALISGRSLADIDRLFPARRLPAAGLHGLERRTADGGLVRHRSAPRALDGARRAVARAVAAHPGLLLEDKNVSLALHYRRAPRLAGFAHRVMRSALAPMAGAYCLQRGKRVIELAPAGADKGAAIGAFMRELPFRGRMPLFIGDDVTDERGFGMVNALGGYAIKVGTGRTAAQWRLPDVRAVLSWLERGSPSPKRATGRHIGRSR